MCSRRRGIAVVGAHEGLVYRQAEFAEMGVPGFEKTILEIRRDLGNLLP